MNNLQPYEKHLADKLQQVPVPDKDEGWIEMRKLLDRDSPEGGGWSGNRKWWWMGITVAIIIAGLWMSQQFRDSENALSNEILAQSNTVSTKESESKTNAGNEKAGTSETSKNETVPPGEHPTSASSTQSANNTDNPSQRKNSAANTNSSGTHEEKSQQQELKDRNAAAVTSGPKKAGVVTLNQENSNSPTRQNETINSPDKNQNRTTTVTKKSGELLVSETGILYANNKKSGGTINNTTGKKNTDPGSNPSVQDETGNRRMPLAPEQKTLISSAIHPTDIEDYPIEDPSELYTSFTLSSNPLKAEPGKTDKAFAKEVRKKSIKEDNRKMSGKSMRGVGREKDHELTFAAGLSLPQSFAIGSQQSPAYGVNAKPGKVSDYLPVPFFQYHVNNRLFLQTELQFQAPQFTDRLLISQSQHPIAPTNGTLEKNVFVEKLYYFHIPFNVYFSPVRNFYLGSGLQFSSLLSGVATYQDNMYNNGTLENSYSRVQGFKDDTLAAKLAPSEWRYQLEGNYYFNRFTFGARYNQAFKQFVNLQPSPTLPFTQGRNKSFLIYLRYNIWEEKKKNAYFTANNW